MKKRGRFTPSAILELRGSVMFTVSALSRRNFAAAQAAAAGEPDLGPLPEWNLADLYPAMDSPAYAADLARAEAECKAFAEAHRGKLAELLASPQASAKLHDAIAHYERLDDLLGKIMSYAGLLYAGNTTDPVRAKFYGDAQEKITNASSDLLFFTLELNRLDDAALNQAMSQAPLAHYRPWIEDIRREKPYQLEDRIELLFHEKSISGRAALVRHILLRAVRTRKAVRIRNLMSGMNQ